MKIFRSSGVLFYFLEEGGLYPDPTADKEYIGAYITFPYDGKWIAQRYKNGYWIDITDKRFDTENEAFNFAYDYFLDPKKHYS